MPRRATQSEAKRPVRLFNPRASCGADVEQVFGLFGFEGVLFVQAVLASSILDRKQPLRPRVLNPKP